jgi:hypothetical protein
VSGHFAAILGCLLNEDWATLRLVEMTLTTDGTLLGRCGGLSTFATFLGAERDLVRNVHGVAEIADLDGDHSNVFTLTRARRVPANLAARRESTCGQPRRTLFRLRPRRPAREEFTAGAE